MQIKHKNHSIWESLFCFGVLFQNIILKYLPYGILSYWDELFCLFFVMLYIGNTFRKKISKDEIFYLCILVVLLVIGIIGNLIFGYQESIDAIIRDVIGFLKFPITFIALYHSKISESFAKKIFQMIPFIKVIIWIIFICGICSLFIDIGMSQEEFRLGIHPYMFLYSHPTYLTTGLGCLLCLLNAAGEANFKEDLVILVSIALGMRTKGLAFIAIYIFSKYSKKWMRRFKVLYWTVIGILVVSVSFSKLMLYASYSNSPRESLYVGALQLMKECFPIGSGFASYASHISGKFLSSVYSFVHISGLYDYKGEISADIGDAGLPYYVGQFGVLGCIVIVYLVYKIFKISREQLTVDYYFPVTMLWGIIVISLPSEAILVNNGFELAFIMIMLIKMCRMCQEGTMPQIKRIRLKI